MVTDAMIEAGANAFAETESLNPRTLAEAVIRAALTRPTADLGEDGELVDRVIAGSLTFRNGNPMQDGDLATVKSEDLRALCDRLILYREALEGLARFHESGGHEGDPDVVIGNARAVLSRSP